VAARRSRRGSLCWPIDPRGHREDHPTRRGHAAMMAAPAAFPGGAVERPTPRGASAIRRLAGARRIHAQCPDWCDHQASSGLAARLGQRRPKRGAHGAPGRAITGTEPSVSATRSQRVWDGCNRDATMPSLALALPFGGRFIEHGGLAMPTPGRLRGGKRFYCRTTGEEVSVARRRRRGGADSLSLFAACSESDCRYAEANEPPCPSSPDRFAPEIMGRRARRRIVK
jgi:hypothetical protein